MEPSLPDAQTLAALVSVPAAIAVIATAGMFLKYMSEQRSADRKQFDEHRAADRLLWSNHLSGTVEVLTTLRDEIRELRREQHR